jgi:epsilon-lactone hydrolase
VVLVGERLGAGLAAAVLLNLRDVGAEPPCCAMLIAGLLDLVMDAPSLYLNAGTDPSFDPAELRARTAAYAAGTTPTDPLLSPLYGNLHGLPPIQLLAAGTDPLLDDSLGFAARAARSGVTVDLQVLPDELSLTSQAVAAAADFVRSYSKVGGTRPA